MKKALIASIATSALVLGSFAMSALSANAYVFSNNLSVGSTGADVTALQTWLSAQGYLTMPAGVSMGYFGSLTKTAVKAAQAKLALPTTGFVGPMTRNLLNAGGMTTTTTTTTGSTYGSLTTCPPTWSCPGLGAITTTTTVAPGTGITTPGVQGILSVTQGPVSNSVANAGQTKVPVLDVRLQAQYSDLAVQSIQLNLGTLTSIYNFVYSTLYVVDPVTNNVLGTIPLNSSTVVQNGGTYVVSVTGFNFIVPKGTYKDLVIKADLYSQINTTYANSTAWTVTVPTQGVRALDGAGVNQYGPTGASIAQTMIIGQSLITSASASISLDSNSPQTGAVGVTNTTQGTYQSLPIMTFDVNAQVDNLHLNSLTVNIGNSGAGTVNAAYLYNGSTQVSSASVVNGQAVFQNIQDGQAGASIPVNSFTAFTVKVDIAGLIPGVTSPAVITASTSNITLYTSIDSSVNSPTGVAIANTQTVFGQGPVFSLAGTPTIAKTNITAGGATTTTFQYTATFNVNVNAVGEPVSLPLASVASGAFGTTSTASGIATPYINGVSTVTSGVIASYTQPSNTVLSANGTYFTVAQNQSVTVPVTYSFTVNSPGANTYAVQLNGINWFVPGVTGTTTATFMANQSAWRTAAI